MKKLLLITAVLSLLLSSFTACESDSSASEGRPPITPKKGLYHAKWDEWGRAARGCDGWGLCNYRDCWFCLEEDVAYSAEVSFNPETGVGLMTIELNNSNEQQAMAIQQHLTFYVDEEIHNPNSILHAGEYQFNPEIGEHGGYALNITVTNQSGNN